MGCASSKPSSSTKTKKEKDKEKQQQQQQSSLNKNSNNKSRNDKNSNTIRLDRFLADQIGQHEERIIEHLVKEVTRSFANELKSSTQKDKEAAAQHDLISDIASKALSTLRSDLPPTSYSQLTSSLKSATYLCKSQTHKPRLCELTVEKIEASLKAMENENLSVLDFLNRHQQQAQFSSHLLTPPGTPQQQSLENKNDEKNAVLLSRAQANELARILFLSSRARPVVHASPKVKDAYFVNKQLTDGVTEICVSQKEIEDILYKFDEPFTFHISNNYHTPTAPQSSFSPSNYTSLAKAAPASLLNTPPVDTNNNDANITIEYEQAELPEEDLTLATAAIISAMAVAASQENANKRGLFDEEDFVKTTIVNTTVTTTTITNADGVATETVDAQMLTTTGINGAGITLDLVACNMKFIYLFIFNSL